MVEPALYAALGASIATLLLLLFLPVFWRRAVRLTTRRLAARLPMSVSEIVASQDRLRAEHAIALREVERRAEAAEAEAARERVASGRRLGDELALKAEIATLREAISALEAKGLVARDDLESASAQVARTLSELEALRSEAKSASAERDGARKAAAASSAEADDLRIDLAAAEAALVSARAEIDDLRRRLAETETARDRAGEAEKARLAVEKRLVDETANAATLRAALARAQTEIARAPAPGDAAQDPALAALRARLDELADEIVRAAGSSSVPPPVGDRSRSALTSSHA